MTSASAAIDIALLCDPETQLASVAPFADLARMSSQLTAELASRSEGAEIRINLLHDSSLKAPPIEGSRPLFLDHVTDFYPVIVVLSCAMGHRGHAHDAPRSVWLRRQHEMGARIGAIGSGVLALVAAGLLNDGPASIPPRYGRLIRTRYPDVRLAHVGALAENGRIVTAAEPCSIFALVVAMTRRFHSHGLAERYRRACGASETALPDDEILSPRGNNDMLVAEARAWIMAHMHHDIDSAAVAARFHVSARTLARRFERSTGITPARFLREVRIDAARSMLQRTNFSVEQIAHLVGYRDVGFFRSLFQRSTGRSPHHYRMAEAKGH